MSIERLSLEDAEREARIIEQAHRFVDELMRTPIPPKPIKLTKAQWLYFEQAVKPIPPGDWK